MRINRSVRFAVYAATVMILGAYFLTEYWYEHWYRYQAPISMQKMKQEYEVLRAKEFREKVGDHEDYAEMTKRLRLRDTDFVLKNIDVVSFWLYVTQPHDKIELQSYFIDEVITKINQDKLRSIRAIVSMYGSVDDYEMFSQSHPPSSQFICDSLMISIFSCNEVLSKYLLSRSRENCFSKHKVSLYQMSTNFCPRLESSDKSVNWDNYYQFTDYIAIAWKNLQRYLRIFGVRVKTT